MSAAPVLLIHGIGDTQASLGRMRAFLEQQGRETHGIDLRPNNAASGLEDLASQVSAYVRATFDPHTPIDLVGFSMGGIVARFYLQRLDGLARVRRFVTISSPHRGTHMAYLHNNKGVRQMRRGSAFLRDLNCDVWRLNGLPVTTIWTPLDLMILPASSAVLPVGRTMRVKVAAHAWMLRDRRVFRLVQAALS